MLSFGAGNLNSYMGGGEDYETPSKASYGNNMQLIFLYIVAGAIVMLFLGPLLTNTSEGTISTSNITNSAGENGGDNGLGGGNEGNNNGLGGSSVGGSSVGGSNNESSNSDDGSNDKDTNKVDEISAESIYQSLMDIDIDKLMNDLSETETWTAAGDTNLLLKVLEKKTYDNSMIDNFDVELALSNGGGSKSLEVKINPMNANITRIARIEILYNDGSVTTKNIQDASMKKRKFIIEDIKDGIKKVTVYDTRGSSVVVSANVNVKDISVEYKEEKINEGNVITIKSVHVKAESEAGISKLEGLDKNDRVEEWRFFNNEKEIDEILSGVGKDSIVRIRLTDSNGFITIVPILK